MTTPLLYNLHVPVGLTTKRCIAFALCLAFVLLGARFSPRNACNQRGRSIVPLRSGLLGSAPVRYCLPANCPPLAG